VLNLCKGKALYFSFNMSSCFSNSWNHVETYDKLLGDTSSTLNGRVLKGKHGVVLLFAPSMSDIVLLLHKRGEKHSYVEGAEGGAVLVKGLVVELNKLLWVSN
jgi:hypothetical protein